MSFFIYLFKKTPQEGKTEMFLPHSTLAKRLLILCVCSYPTECNQALLCPKSKKMPSNQFQSYRRVLKGEALWTNIYEFGRRKLSSIFFRLCHRQDEIGNPWTFCHPEWRHKILTFSLGRSSLPPLRRIRTKIDGGVLRRA